MFCIEVLFYSIMNRRGEREHLELGFCRTESPLYLYIRHTPDRLFFGEFIKKQEIKTTLLMEHNVQ